MNLYGLQIAEIVAINCMLALGMYMSLSCGMMVMCFGAVMSIGGIASAASYSSGVPYPVALLCGGICAALAGAAVYITCARLTRFLLAIATLGLGELARAIATNTEALGGALGYRNIRPEPSTLYGFIILAGLIGAFAFLEKSPIRTALRLIADSDVVAASLGIDVGMHRFGVMVVGSFIVGVSGGLYIHAVGLLDPRLFGFDASVQILVFAIIGGVTTYLGPVLGAVSLTILPEVLRFSSSSRMLLYGATLVAVMVFRPEGLVASRVKDAPKSTCRQAGVVNR